MTRTFTWVNGKPISFSDEDGVKHLVSDPDGNIIQIKSSDGTILSETEYTPYGSAETTGESMEGLPGFAAAQGFIHGDGVDWMPASGPYRPDLGRFQSKLKSWPEQRSSVSAFSIFPNRRPGDPTGLAPVFADVWRCMMDPLSCIPKGFPLPDFVPPPPGKGCNDYVPGWDPWSFGYGECCGMERRCSGTPDDEPIDCVDLACSIHDGQIPDVWSYIGRAAHAQLCARLSACDCSEWTIGSLEHHNCVSAKNKIMGLFCTMSRIGPPIYW